MSSDRKKAIAAINRRGALLVYPLANKKEPLSLWSELFPRAKMRWEWDENGDSRVADLWHLRATLSISREVVYAKWYQGRATFFSMDVAKWLIAYMSDQPAPLGESARIFEALEMDSPLSTKQVKEAVELQGKFFESTYEKSMKVLWRRLWIVGFGEVEDSSFPSLAVGATRLIFEELWNEASGIDPRTAARLLEEKLGAENPFWLFARKAKDGSLPKRKPEVAPAKPSLTAKARSAEVSKKSKVSKGKTVQDRRPNR